MLNHTFSVSYYKSNLYLINFNMLVMACRDRCIVQARRFSYYRNIVVGNIKKKYNILLIL